MLRARTERIGGSAVSASGRMFGVLVITVGLFAFCAIALAAPAGAQPSCSQSGGTVTCTFGFTGDAQTWTVPPDVTTGAFDVQGAQGGIGSDSDVDAPGAGGEAAADLPLTPGATVTLSVGGQGGSPAPCSGPGGGGFNGGAAGGSLDLGFGGCIDGGGGGGGASDVRIGGSDLTNRVLVAGGGGGTPAGVGCGNGGGGGGLTGGDATQGINHCGTAQGTGGDQTGATGSGQPGLGSVGATGGAGGGGGYFGGAGSGYQGGGGGGSGFGPEGTTFQTGVNGGNGVITVSYTAPTASITTPADDATYTRNQVVDSSFTCTDISGGPGIQSCLDQNGNPSGTAIDTSTLGSHTFTVTATNQDGLSGTASVTYTVKPSAGDLAATLIADSRGQGPGTALADKATAILTAINAGQTSIACADISNYLGLVKAQTAKKLAQSEATTLTTDADNVATTLGCS